MVRVDFHLRFPSLYVQQVPVLNGRLFTSFINLQSRNLIAFSPMLVVCNKIMYTILKLIGLMKCKFYNIHYCIGAAKFVCEIYFFCGLQAYVSAQPVTEMIDIGESPFQRALTCLLVVLAKNSCILFYILSNKGTFEPVGQFSRKRFCNLCNWRKFNSYTQFRDIANNSFRDLQTYDVRATRKY